MSCFVVTCRQMVGHDLSKVCNSCAMNFHLGPRWDICIMTRHVLNKKTCYIYSMHADPPWCVSLQDCAAWLYYDLTLSVALAALHAFKHNGNAHAKIPHNWYPYTNLMWISILDWLSVHSVGFGWVPNPTEWTESQSSSILTTHIFTHSLSWKLETVSIMRTTRQPGNFIRNDKTMTKWKQQAFIEQITTKWVNLSCRRRQPQITITRNLYPFFTPLMYEVDKH